MVCLRLEHNKLLRRTFWRTILSAILHFHSIYSLHSVFVYCCVLLLLLLLLLLVVSGHFRSRDKEGGHVIRSAIADNHMLHANFTALSSVELNLLPIKDLRCGNRAFRAFLWPWTWPDDLHIRNWPVSPEDVPTVPQTENELSTSRLSKVITYWYRHTKRYHRNYYHSASPVVNIDRLLYNSRTATV